MCKQAHPHSHTGYSVDGHSHPERSAHPRANRRDFLHVLGGAMAGASVLEMGFFRATVARAQAPAAAQNLFDIEKVSDGIFAALAHPAVITNCNAAIFVNFDHVLVVDAHSKPSAAASLIAQIKREVTNKPVRYLVNSHFHYDHTQGDPAYKKQGVKIIASETTKRLMQENAQSRAKASVDGVPQMLDMARSRLAKATSAADRAWCNDQIRQLEAYAGEMKAYTPELPDITFDKTHVLKDRDQELHIEFRGRAHTAGDIVVFSPQRRVVATGDMIGGFLPAMGDGYPREWPASIDAVGQLQADSIIPGHGPVNRNHEHRIQLRNYIEELTGVVANGKRAGKTIAELQKTITVSSLKSLQANGYAKFVSDNFSKFSVFLGTGTAIDDRLKGNIDAVYKNLDRA